MTQNQTIAAPANEIVHATYFCASANPSSADVKKLPKERKLSTWSQTVLMITKSGTAINAPMIPQSQAQNATEMNTATMFS
jgi:hypothetical protein